MKITPANIVNAISRLPRDQWFDYASQSTTTRIMVTEIVGREGPIRLLRYKVGAANGPNDAKIASISAEMISKLANALAEKKPIHVDVLYKGGGNTRQAFEALLAHTPEFYVCYPTRTVTTSYGVETVDDQKHLVWLPDQPHQNGVLGTTDISISISEIRHEEHFSLSTPPKSNNDIDLRRHAQIQVELIEIGQRLGFRTWVAANDRGIEYDGKSIGSLRGVVPTLSSERMISIAEGGPKAAGLVDCIWFRNGNAMPAVMEIEHSTGVTTGLTRMSNLKSLLPPYSENDVRWTIVAPDELRQKVINEANKPMFKDLKTKFFPYSAVDELHSFCRRRPVQGVNDEFLDSFMEKVVLPS